ncbi:hypothetical protein F5Y00DRAFT_249196 [Daldinia vernicosa]|uniref:uncharacterized protein n=1 Tax=Daldinia vernicosa TaxID=114800 RepID=UPI002007FA4F|nr:uncharacterized protein F5Y00DRAFT_249196 [Daldinia vernicosa]KAI0844236.1 hypothetical protein F5Y00DRAFT_249196 [Daldinia vernicosa]
MKLLSRQVQGSSDSSSSPGHSSRSSQLDPPADLPNTSPKDKRPTCSPRKRSQDSLPDTDSSPRKKSKSPPEERPLIPQNISNSSTISNGPTISDLTIHNWLDILEEGDILEEEETYSYSDMPKGSGPVDSEVGTVITRNTGISTWLDLPWFRQKTLRENSIKLLYNNDPIPEWVQSHINKINSYPADNAPNFSTKWKRFQDTVHSQTNEAIFEKSYNKMLDILDRDDNWTLNRKENQELIVCEMKSGFQKHSLPPVKDKPDLVYGYNSWNSFPNFYTQFAPTTSYAIIFPYLAMEFKGHLGHIVKAENQAFVDGRICLDTTWSCLGNHDFIIVAAADPNRCRIWGMWRTVENETDDHEGAPAYYMKPIATFDPQFIEDAEELRNYIFRIHRWAREYRFPLIAAGVKKWEAAGRPRHKFSPVGR